MSDQRNLVLAIVLSIAILIVFDLFYIQPQMEAQRAFEAQQEAQQESLAAGGEGATTGDSAPLSPNDLAGAPAGVSTDRSGLRDRAAVLADSPRVPIDNGRLHGSISATGSRINDLTLADYHVTPAREEEVVLLSPTGTADPYYAEFGWVAGEGTDQALPGRDTLWETSDGPLTADNPVTKRWENGQGLVFERTIALDANYMFTITDRVINQGDSSVTLFPYGLISRHGKPPTFDFFILHEGPIGVLADTLEELSYKQLREEGEVRVETTGGWLGITDKYWLVSLIPDQSEPVLARFLHTPGDGLRPERFQSDYLGRARSVAPGASTSVTTRLFAGAKEVDLLDAYETELNVPTFDKAVDFGMFYFMTKPFFYALDFLGGMTGNFGVAIILFTIALRLVMFPLANKSFKELSRMKALQPEMKAIQERAGDDRERMQRELMELYKKEKVNPVAGCLPILIQIPIFFALYKVLFVTIEMRHEPFFGWIQDLSAPDPLTVFNLFGLIPWDPPGFLMIGIWPLLMGFSMWLQQKLNPAPTDPMQAKIMMFLPIVFTFILAGFPAGLVIYWTFSNLFSILQQWLIMRRMGVGLEGQKTS